MSRAIGWLILTLTSWTPVLAADSILPESTKETVTRVCGFCHFPDFFDEETGQLIERKFLEQSEKILDRLQRPSGAAGRMPPKRSPVTLTDEERQDLVDVLKAISLPIP